MASYKNKCDTILTELCTCIPDDRKQDKYSGVVSIVFIHLVVTVTALVALVGYFYYQDVYYNIPLVLKEHTKDFSIYCDDISLGPDDDIKTFDTQINDLTVSVNDDGIYICTYRSKDVMKVVKQVVERTTMLMICKDIADKSIPKTSRNGLENRQYLSCGNESLAAVSGHLTFKFSGVSQHQKYEGNESDLVLHWDKHSELSYVAPNIHYHKGDITIPEGRTYFIYASVHINISRGDDNGENDRPRTFTLRICRKVNGYEQTLLGKTQLFNISHGDVVSSLNVGNYLLMSRNDIIYIKVSDAYSIIHESRGNTFGMFPLST